VFYLTKSTSTRIRESFEPTLRYAMETEAHVHALAFAASVLLSFFPFLIVMLSIARNLLHWPAAVNAVFLALQDYFPDELFVFMKRNLMAVLESRRPLQITSLFLLLLTANAVFLPLEVALNRVWRATGNRSYWKNQLLSLGLIFACGALAMLSFVLAAVNRQYLGAMFGLRSGAPYWISIAFFKLAAIPASILGLFLVYWLVPNRKIAPLRVVPAAILVGIALEAVKNINLAIWPLFKSKLQSEYGPFYISVTVVLFSFAAAMVVLAGAEWAARRERVKTAPSGHGS